MTAPLYTAEAQVTGGRNGRGRTSDGRLDLDLRLPKELGGDGEGANPEQLFAVGYAACFGTVLAMVGQRENLKADDARIDASVSLIPAAAAVSSWARTCGSRSRRSPTSRPSTWSRPHTRRAPTPTPPAATSTWPSR
ncbi:Ohr family peroxiredoxin [Actinomadura madurae]|uniref:Ohr family peroxiredoxin n=1 Tax=Actinomadura madurae TaxID=1993 RepID=UPI0035571AC1